MPAAAKWNLSIFCGAEPWRGLLFNKKINSPMIAQDGMCVSEV
ncbi:hypothetical protein [Desulfovibrio sp.]|nr:hypothetical protein [Desulfovibrio sp.]